MKTGLCEAIAELAQMEVQQSGVMSHTMEQTAVRPRLHHSQTLRSAPAGAARTGRGPGRDGQRGRDPPDRGHGSLPRALEQFVYRTGLLMKPVFDAARTDPKRVVYAER
jgi:malate dehydrogenase (oxaloacetate-decarboxylating)(NADP+)